MAGGPIAPVDFRLFGGGGCGLAHMQGPAVTAPEAGCRALQWRERLAQRCPTVVDVCCFHGFAQCLDRLVGEDRDEQVSVGAPLFVMEDRTQAELGFQRAEHGFGIGEGRVGLPHGLCRPVEDVAAQAVDPGMGQRGIVDGVEGPGDGCCPGSGAVGGDGDFVVGLIPT